MKVIALALGQEIQYEFLVDSIVAVRLCYWLCACVSLCVCLCVTWL